MKAFPHGVERARPDVPEDDAEGAEGQLQEISAIFVVWFQADVGKRGSLRTLIVSVILKKDRNQKNDKHSCFQ